MRSEKFNSGGQKVKFVVSIFSEIEVVDGKKALGYVMVTLEKSTGTHRNSSSVTMNYPSAGFSA